MNHVVKATLSITDEEIDDIMTSAMQGIAYWCDEAKLHGFIKPQDEGIWTSQGLTRGYRIGIHDEEEDKTYILTLKKFLHGIALYNKPDFYSYDMYDADNVIQLALFGEQVYA